MAHFARIKHDLCKIFVYSFFRNKGIQPNAAVEFFAVSFDWYTTIRFSVWNIQNYKKEVFPCVNNFLTKSVMGDYVSNLLRTNSINSNFLLMAMSSFFQFPELKRISLNTLTVHSVLSLICSITIDPTLQQFAIFQNLVDFVFFLYLKLFFSVAACFFANTIQLPTPNVVHFFGNFSFFYISFF